MKSWALVTTPYAWWVPRSLSLLTTNSVWSTQMVMSGAGAPSQSVEGRQHVADRDGVERGGDEDRAGRLDGVLPHGVLRRERVAVHAGQRAVVANRAGQHVRDPLGHQRVHDAALDEPGLHGALDGAGGAHPVDGAHVQPVAALGRLAGVAHAERGAEDRGLDVVHGDRVAGQHRLHVAVAG